MVSNNPDALEQLFHEIAAELQQLASLFLLLEQNWTEGDKYELAYLDTPKQVVTRILNTIHHFSSKGEFTPQAAQNIQQIVASFVRNFDNPFFETQYRNQINHIISALSSLSRR